MDSAPAGATRMGSRSSTRHGGPAQVFVGPVRRWRKVWSPVSSSSPSPSAARILLYKWNPLTPSNGGTGAKEDSNILEETTTFTPRPVKYLPVAVVIQRKNEEIAMKAVEEAEEPSHRENENEGGNDTATDMVVDVKVSDSGEIQDKCQGPQPSTGDSN